MADQNFLTKLSNEDFSRSLSPSLTRAVKQPSLKSFYAWANLFKRQGLLKGRKGDKHATSDWMAMEKQRGISITSSVDLQFPL